MRTVPNDIVLSFVFSLACHVVSACKRSVRTHQARFDANQFISNSM